MSHEFQWSVRAAFCRPSEARHHFIDWLNEEGIAGVPADDWALVFSELMTNACAASPEMEDVDVHASALEDRIVLRLDNATSGSVPEVQRAVTPRDRGGRGLRIVEQLTDGLEFELGDDNITVVCWTARDDGHVVDDGASPSRLGTIVRQANRPSAQP